MQIPPADVIATLPSPNYTNPVEHAPVTTVVNVVLLPLCVIIIGLRIFSRTKIAKSFGLDDVLIVLAFLPAIPFCVVSVLAELRYGWDRHVWDVPPEKIELGLRLILACECLFAASCTCTKLSVLVFIRRMLHNTNSKTRIIALVAMIIIAAQGVVFCFVVIFQCNPVSDYWKLSTLPQNCLNQPTNLLAAGIINTFTDLCVVIIPIPVVMGLQLPTRQQIFCISLFSAGLIVCVAGAVRTWALWAVSETVDQTWAGYKVWLTGAIEMYLAILCACLPALKGLALRYFPRLLGAFNSFGRSNKSEALRTIQSMTQGATKRASSRTDVPPIELSIAKYEHNDEQPCELVGSVSQNQATCDDETIRYPAPVMLQHDDIQSLVDYDHMLDDPSYRSNSLLSERSDAMLVRHKSDSGIGV